ncbi:hypothetical protein V6N11_081391 [Hibiscus sabdariffa]|uniref:Uncharacterized protein n=1 Tax=Hibiscus sabdariffa TaxID=183260 RepID=A0ABR2QJN3_9ROSI
MYFMTVPLLFLLLKCSEAQSKQANMHSKLLCGIKSQVLNCSLSTLCENEKVKEMIARAENDNNAANTIALCKHLMIKVNSFSLFFLLILNSECIINLAITVCGP